MRLNLNVKSQRRLHKEAQVFLNGVRQHQCLIADSDKGFVYRYKTDGNGNKIPRQVGVATKYATEVVNGEVKIIVDGIAK